MLAYLNYLNRNEERKLSSDRTIQAAAKIASWICLRDGLQLVPAKRDELVKALENVGDGEDLLDHLESDLKLFRTVGVTRDHMVPTLDPLAEYLAALYLVEQIGGKESAWREWYEQVPSDAGQKARGFLLALRECWLASGSEGINESAARDIDVLLSADRQSLELLLEA